MPDIPARPRPERDEEGATIPFVALLVVTLLLFAGFAIDLGSLAATNRNLQAVADIASLDAARELSGQTCDAMYQHSDEAEPSTLWDHVRTAALESAQRNSFVPGGDRTLSVALGVVTDGTFTTMMDETTPLCSTVPDAVRVLASDRTGYGFARVIGVTGQDSGRDAVAGRVNEGAFVVGSALATIDTAQSALYNAMVRPVLQTAICRGSTGCNASLALVGYNSLVSTTVRLGDLAAEMGAGNPDDVLNAPSVRVGPFLSAAARVLDAQGTTEGDVAAANLFALAAQVNTTTQIRISDFLQASAGDGTAADAEVDALTIFRAAAAIANGTNAITVPNANLNIADIATIGFQLNALEMPVVVVGRPGVSGTTTQAPVRFTVNLDLNVLNLVRITGGLPINTAAATGTGTLASADCSGDPGITVDTSAQAVNLTSSGTLVVRALLPLANLTVNGTGVASADPTTALRFDYPDDYYISQRTGNAELGLRNIAYGNPTVQLLPPLFAPLPVPVSTIMNELKDVLALVDSQVVTPVHQALGLNVGSASVTAIDPLSCGDIHILI